MKQSVENLLNAIIGKSNDGCWSTRTFANLYFYQLVPKFLVLHIFQVDSFFILLVRLSDTLTTSLYDLFRED